MEVLPMRTSPVLLLALLAGCTYVTQGEVEALLATVDTDGDGWEDSVDCAALDPTIHPRGELDTDTGCYLETETGAEVADGIDNDCSCGDLVDGDGDGYPALPEVTYRALAAEVQGIAPAEVVWPTDLREEVDCDDTSRDVYPGAEDAPYDGIDSDCGCSLGQLQTACNDFDADGDGYVDRFADRSIADAFFLAYPALGLEPVDALYDDCDDTTDAIYPGAPGEEDYDKVDTDCAGDNDFDADGDGYTPTAFEDELAEFISTYHPGTAPSGPDTWGPGGTGPVQLGDCLDELPDLAWIPGVDPADVNPGAADTFGDGIDSDCAGDNDFDADGDGVAAPGVTETEVEAYIRNWSGYDVTDATTLGFPNTLRDVSVALEDCDDADPRVFPGQVESLFDTIDLDCDGEENGTPMRFGDYFWDTPYQPRAIATSDYIVFGTTAQSAWAPVVGTADPYRDHAALTLRFDATAARSTDAPVEQRWDNIVGGTDPRVHGPAFDMVADGDAFWLASSIESQIVGNLRLTQYLVARHLPVTTGQGFSLRVRFTDNTDLSVAPGLDSDLDLDIIGNQLWITSTGGAGRTFDDNGEFIYLDEDDLPVDPPTQPAAVRSTSVDMTEFGVLGVEWLARDSLALQDSGGAAISNGDVCLLVPGATPADGATYLVCDDVGCLVYDGTSTIGASADTFTSAGVREADQKDGVLLVVPEDGGIQIQEGDLSATPITLLPGEPVLSADALWVDTTGDGNDDTFFVAAVVEGTPNELRIGSTTTPSTIAPSFTTLDTSDPDSRATRCVDPADAPATCVTEVGRTLEPQRVELAATSSRLAVFYTATSPDAGVATATLDYTPRDAVGWAFFSYYQDADGDGYPAQPVDGPTLHNSFVDPDDFDATLTP